MKSDKEQKKLFAGAGKKLEILFAGLVISTFA